MTHFSPGMTPNQLGDFYMSVAKEMLRTMKGALPLIVALAVIRSIVFLGMAMAPWPRVISAAWVKVEGAGKNSGLAYDRVGLRFCVRQSRDNHGAHLAADDDSSRRRLFRHLALFRRRADGDCTRQSLCGYAGAGYFYLYRIAALFFEATIAVSVMRYALGERDRPAIVRFAVGLAELRVFGALVAYTLIVTTIEIAWFVALRFAAAAIVYGTKIVGRVDGIAPGTVAVWTVDVLLASFFAGIVFVSIRLSFFLVALTVVEKRIDLIRAWELTRGNFWRAVLITLCIGLPTWLVYMGLQFAFVGFAAIGEATGAFSPMTEQTIGQVQAVTARMHFVQAWLPYLYVAWFLVRHLHAWRSRF